MSLKEVFSLSLDDFNLLWEAITILEAQETLLKLNISQYPYMKKDTAKKFHKDIFEKAYPKNKERARKLSTADLARLSGAGIVREIKPNGG